MSRVLKNPGGKFLVAVYTCERYRHKRRRVIDRCWAQQQLPNVEVVYIYGGSDADKVVCDEVHLKVPEGYENLARKTWRMLSFLAGHYQFDYLIKIDDDVYISDLQKLLSEVESTDYFGKLYNKPPFSPAYAAGKMGFFYGSNDPGSAGHDPIPHMQGSCYALSRRMVNEIVKLPAAEIPLLQAEFGQEDIMVGYCVGIAKRAIPTAVVENSHLLYSCWRRFGPRKIKIFADHLLINDLRPWEIRLLTRARKMGYLVFVLAMASLTLKNPYYLLAFNISELLRRCRSARPMGRRQRAQ